MAKFQVPIGWGTDELVAEIDRLNTIIDGHAKAAFLAESLEQAGDRAVENLRRQAAKMTAALNDREREVLAQRFGSRELDTICWRCSKVVLLSITKRDQMDPRNRDICIACIEGK